MESVDPIGPRWTDLPMRNASSQILYAVLPVRNVGLTSLVPAHWRGTSLADHPERRTVWPTRCSAHADYRIGGNQSRYSNLHCMTRVLGAS